MIRERFEEGGDRAGADRDERLHRGEPDAAVAIPQGLDQVGDRLRRVGTDPGGERLIDALERMERSMIVSALEKSGWVKARAARSLGLNERVLTYKMNSLGIERA
jgi:transcriptional regulator with GAF, ATPase, and Fis domain